jgi:hypothetical protein
VRLNTGDHVVVSICGQHSHYRIVQFRNRRQEVLIERPSGWGWAKFWTKRRFIVQRSTKEFPARGVTK